MGTHTTLIGNIAVQYVASAHARVCYVCAQSFFVAHVHCVCCCRDQVGCWCKDGETQEGERFGHVGQSQAQRYRVCSSRVYHTPLIWALRHDEKPSALTIRCFPAHPSPHRNELSDAENSGSEITSPTVEKALSRVGLAASAAGKLLRGCNALRTQQNESGVAASASVADITSLVTI